MLSLDGQCRCLTDARLSVRRLRLHLAGCRQALARGLRAAIHVLEDLIRASLARAAPPAVERRVQGLVVVAVARLRRVALARRLIAEHRARLAEGGGGGKQNTNRENPHRGPGGTRELPAPRVDGASSGGRQAALLSPRSRQRLIHVLIHVLMQVEQGS
eukprot:gene4297-biopygen599